mgnify:CR=1 FL=1
MKKPLILVIAMTFVASANAQTDQSFKKAFICQQEDGSVRLVKDEDLPSVRDALCRTIEYRQALDTRVRSCKLHKGGASYTDGQLFRVEAGCTVIKEPLQ